MTVSAAVNSYTPNYGFRLINFNYPRWHTEEWRNWQLLDATLKSLNLLASRGVWENATAYAVGDRVIDVNTGVVYQTSVAHTSAGSGTFGDDRTANPTYWTQMTQLPNYRGSWVTATSYYSGDIVVVSSQKWYYCLRNHTSGASITADSAYWTIIFDISSLSNTYYGARGTETSLRPDGTASQAGDIYFNTGSALLRLYNGSAWINFSTSTAAASGITFSPTGNIAATDVQAAIAELDSEKVSKAGDTISGAVTINNNLLVNNLGIATAPLYPFHMLADADTSKYAFIHNQHNGNSSAMILHLQSGSSGNNVVQLGVFNNAGNPEARLLTGSGITYTRVYSDKIAFQTRLGANLADFQDGAYQFIGSTTSFVRALSTAGIAAFSAESSGTNVSLYYFANASGERARIGATNAREWYVSIDSGATNGLFLDSSNQLAIGHSVPTAKLDVNGGIVGRTFVSTGVVALGVHYIALVAGGASLGAYLATFNANGTRRSYANYWNTTQYDWLIYESTEPVRMIHNGSTRLTVQTGIQIGAPTGGDKGANTLNVQGNIYENNTRVLTAVTSADGSLVVSGGDVALNLAGAANIGDYTMACVNSGTVAGGATIAGSNLRYASFNSSGNLVTSANTPTGTWRYKGSITLGLGEFGLFQRVL